MLRVINVVTQMNRDGMESRLMDIYRHLDTDKVQFDFYTFRMEEGQFDQEIQSLGGRIYYNRPLSIVNVRRRRAEFADFLGKHPEYKIVHAHMNAWCGLLLRSAQEAGVPIRIAHSRTSLEKMTLKNAVKNITKLPVNRFATHRFAVSRKAAIWLYGKKVVEQGETEVWPNAIEYDKFQYDMAVRREMRSILNVEKNLVIMHVGNYRFEKNHLFLLKVFAEVKKRNSSAHLILVGRGDWDKVRLKAEHLGVIDSLTFTGSRSDVSRLLQAGDVFVFPSLYEGFPGAVLEAQAAGLPCVISDSITEEVCITPLVERISLSLSAEQWAEKILVKSNSIREPTRDYFRSKGFDINSLVGKLTDFYQSVSEGPSGELPP